MSKSVTKEGSLVKDWTVLISEGLGVQECPTRDGRSLGVFTGTEDEVKAFVLEKNIEINGPKETWSSWQYETCIYREVVQLNSKK